MKMPTKAITIQKKFDELGDKFTELFDTLDKFREEHPEKAITIANAQLSSKRVMQSLEWSGLRRNIKQLMKE